MRAAEGGVLAAAGFRRFWLALGLSSLGDWMGLLAITALANALADGYADRSFAIAGVLFVRVLPALVIGPIGGYLADRLDRRLTLVVGSLLRAAIFVSIPLVDTLGWLLVATVLVEAVSVVWLPAKDATVPNLVARDQLESANRLVLATTYGAAVPAAALFAGLSVLTEALNSGFGWFSGSPVELVLWVNAAAFALSGLVFIGLRDAIPAGAAIAAEDRAGVWRGVLDGWAYVARTPLIRGLVVGIVGAFAAGGVVIALARVHVDDLGAGDPGYGVLFGAVFAGLGLGMWHGPRALPGVTRRRLFGLALVASGLVLAAISLVGDMVLAAVLTVLLGYAAGVAWLCGYTILGLEVEDALRGRTFGFVASLVRLVLALVLALAPLVAGLVGAHRWRISDDVALTYGGTQLTFLAAAVLTVGVGVASFRQMNDRPGVSVAAELRQAWRASATYASRGLFVALEGGEGVGKSTQVRLLGEWLTAGGYEAVLTQEPGATEVGAALRRIVLDPATGALSPRTEALLYAADKAEHVARVVRPALERGAVVVTDRYVDSTLAYQGAGRDLSVAEVEPVARWATTGLRPHLTVLLDVPAGLGLSRVVGLDRIEAEPVEFHERVRASYRVLAEADPDHYLVVEDGGSPDEVAALVQARVKPLLAHAVRHP